MSWNYQPFFAFQDRRTSSIGVSVVLLIWSHAHSTCHFVGWSLCWSVHWLVGWSVHPSVRPFILLLKFLPKRHPNHITAPAPLHAVVLWTASFSHLLLSFCGEKCFMWLILFLRFNLSIFTDVTAIEDEEGLKSVAPITTAHMGYSNSAHGVSLCSLVK